MARKKNAKALYEVIGAESIQAGRPPRVPGWVGPAGGPEDEQAPDREPALSASDGRVRISLNQLSAAVLLVVLLGLLVTAFVWGRRVGVRAAKAAASAAGAAGAPKVLPRPRPGPNVGTTQPSGMVPENYQRRKGYSYLVIQDGLRGQAEGMDIKKFLYDNGINVTVHRSAVTPFYRVKDTRGFRNLSRPEIKAALAQHRAQIERLGREYQRRGGRYAFLGSWLETEQ